MLKERLAEVFGQCFDKYEGLAFAGISDGLCNSSIINSIRDLVALECRFIQASKSKINQNRLGMASFGFRDATLGIQLDVIDDNGGSHDLARQILAKKEDS